MRKSNRIARFARAAAAWFVTLGSCHSFAGGPEVLPGAAGQNRALPADSSASKSGYADFRASSLGVEAVEAVRRRLALPEIRNIPAALLKRYEKQVSDAAKTYRLDVALLQAIITVESAYNAKARSERGAAGLMQLTPEIARAYDVADALDPSQNVQAGARYMRSLMTWFGNDMALALAAYNAGPGSVIKHGRRIPPYRETRSYVWRVLAHYRKYLDEPVEIFARRALVMAVADSDALISSSRRKRL